MCLCASGLRPLIANVDRAPMNEPVEFAEEYSFAERVRLICVGVPVGGVWILAWKVWLRPWLDAFVESAPCRPAFGISGVTVLWYGLFVGLPLLLACILACMEGRRGLRILRDGQSPPIGQKVLRPTRIRRGAAARRSGYLHLFAFTPLLVVAIWGSFQAASLSAPSRLKHPACPASDSLRRAPADGLR